MQSDVPQPPADEASSFQQVQAARKYIAEQALKQQQQQKKVCCPLTECNAFIGSIRFVHKLIHSCDGRMLVEHELR